MKKPVVLSYLATKNKPHIPALILLTVLETLRAYLGVAFAMATRTVIDCAQAGRSEALVNAGIRLGGVILGIMALYAAAQYLRGRLKATLDREWKMRLSHLQKKRLS